MLDRVVASRTGPPPGRPDLTMAMWASLVPLMLLLHPYAGLVGDARIYVGRGVADRDPAGVGRDIMFVHDGQNGFSIMRSIVSACLTVMGPGPSAMALAFCGAMLWLLAAVALSRSLAGGRTAWAVVACMVALPTFYGAYGVFDYAEVIATPRVFAQAAVLAGLAALVAGRIGVSVASLAVATAFHPLIALPGVAVAAALLVAHDQRWLLAVAAAAVAIVAGAALHVPVMARLVEPMDDVWLAILRQRSMYLFPTLWPASSFGPILCQATAVLVASAVSAPRVRTLLLATLGVAASALAVSWLFGDVHPSTLVVQLQPWRALWLLAALGNAALALAAARLWKRGPDAALVLAPLLVAWIWSDKPFLVVPLAVLTLFWFVAMVRHAVPVASPLVLHAVACVVIALALLDMVETASVGLMLVRSARRSGAPVNWPSLVGLRIQAAPVVACALALGSVSSARPSGPLRGGVVAAVACAGVLAAWMWDGRTPERRAIERGDAAPALSAAIGPSQGEVLWVDEGSETWFLAGRPSFFNSLQGAPALFSRALAVDWADRAAFVRRLGLAREAAVSPWTDPHPRLDPIVPRPDAVSAFCASPRRPAAVVVPGDQLGAAPPGWTAVLWRPAEPFRRMWIDGETIRWSTWDVFTVIRCPAPGAVDG